MAQVFAILAGIFGWSFFATVAVIAESLVHMHVRL
jgi:hypothetical protein